MDASLDKSQVSQAEDVLRSKDAQNDPELDLKNAQRPNEDELHNLRTDKHGLPLVPQPTQHKDDPLVSFVALTSIHFT